MSSAEFPPETRPMPTVRKFCARCGVDEQEFAEGDAEIIVSPRGTAHYGQNNGDTDCGLTATGENWWWPL